MPDTAMQILWVSKFWKYVNLLSPRKGQEILLFSGTNFVDSMCTCILCEKQRRYYVHEE
jgi:hypothetical protein